MKNKCETLTQPGRTLTPTCTVQHRDLGRAQDVDIDILPLEANGGDLGVGYTAHSDVLDMLAHQGDPGPLQHGAARAVRPALALGSAGKI